MSVVCQVCVYMHVEKQGYGAKAGFEVYKTLTTNYTTPLLTSISP